MESRIAEAVTLGHHYFPNISYKKSLLSSNLGNITYGKIKANLSGTNNVRRSPWIHFMKNNYKNNRRRSFLYKNTFTIYTTFILTELKLCYDFNSVLRYNIKTKFMLRAL